MRANEDIRATAKNKEVKLWEIADKLGIFDSNFSKKIRHELTATEKQRIFAIIDEIAAEKENAAHSATNTMNG